MTTSFEPFAYLLDPPGVTMIKAISLRQPWANLIASRDKTIETRTWSTKYRGDLVIISSKSPKIEPAGCTVALVRLVDCRPMTRDDEAAACCELYPRAWAWVLENIRPLEPVPVKGQLRLYEIPKSLVREVSDNDQAQT